MALYIDGQGLSSKTQLSRVSPLALPRPVRMTTTSRLTSCNCWRASCATLMFVVRDQYRFQRPRTMRTWSRFARVTTWSIGIRTREKVLWWAEQLRPMASWAIIRLWRGPCKSTITPCEQCTSREQSNKRDELGCPLKLSIFFSVYIKRLTCLSLYCSFSLFQFQICLNYPKSTDT